jgi:hypothetical protein
MTNATFPSLEKLALFVINYGVMGTFWLLNLPGLTTCAIEKIKCPSEFRIHIE